MSDATPNAAGRFTWLTGLGPAAIAVVRVWGGEASDFLNRHLRFRRHLALDTLPPGQILRAALLDPDGAPVDDALVSIHANTLPLDLRIYLHGNPWLVHACTAWLEQAGLTEDAAAPLWPASNTLDADLHRRLPEMRTWRGTQWLLEQPGRLAPALRELLNVPNLTDHERAICHQIASRAHIASWFSQPLRVVVCGPPNAGKSTLVNALSDRPVSVVASVAGTTRDWVEAVGEVDGFPVTWVDTAGLHAAADAIEAAGVERTRDLIGQADVVLFVADATSAWDTSAPEFAAVAATQPRACLVLNKTDQPRSRWHSEPHRVAELTGRDPLPVSALQGTGLPGLSGRVLASAGRSSADLTQPAAFSEQQAQMLHAAAAASDLAAFRRAISRLLAPPPTSSETPA